MIEALFFLLGLVNSIILILIFIIRKIRIDLLQRFGWVYFFLAVPAVYGILLVQQEHKPVEYAIFLGIFLAFLAIEALYDWILKIPFREAMNFKQLAPYVILYMAMNYGFVVMAWKNSFTGGIFMLSLFILQIITNIITHPPKIPAGKKQ